MGEEGFDDCDADKDGGGCLLWSSSFSLFTVGPFLGLFSVAVDSLEGFSCFNPKILTVNIVLHK